MGDEIKTWLTDIKQAIQEIERFLPAKKNFIAFKKDIKTRKAIERNIEIIGEAINRTLKKRPEIGISHAKKIIATRNRIIHGYDTVSEDIIWTIVLRDLPLHKKEINELLK